MAVIKCKMCGGDLQLIPGQTVAECEYCGTRQTVPSADNEKKLALFARANRLRFTCEFDKAAGVYEAIVADFPEEAEAYWGLVLCRYGIEYVEDPATGKMVPTCHRTSFDALTDDSDYEQTLENSDALSRKVYREEARQIEEIRKGIVEVSSREAPYDVFICYKETDDQGERTLDSVLSQDIYDALTDRGYRVFFARITLEDKLGQEYEPYIFAALNSARVMLVIGTDYEYFNAVWVKNEWSRFLKLMAKDKSRHLIPCYRGLDAYDMPKEFSKLQAQDLGKVGAVQDLLRGVDKLIAFSRNAAPVDAKVDTDEISNAVTYRTALDAAGKGTVRDLKDAIRQLKTISGWRDADKQLAELEARLKKKKRAVLIRNLAILAAAAALVLGGLSWLSSAPSEAPPATEALLATEAPLEETFAATESNMSGFDYQDGIRALRDQYNYRFAREIFEMAGDPEGLLDQVNRAIEEEGQAAMRIDPNYEWEGTKGVYLSEGMLANAFVPKDGSCIEISYGPDFALPQNPIIFYADWDMGLGIGQWECDWTFVFQILGLDTDDFAQSGGLSLFDNGNLDWKSWANPRGYFRYDAEAGEFVFLASEQYDMSRNYVTDTLFTYEGTELFRGILSPDGSLRLFNGSQEMTLYLANSDD